MIVSRFSRLGLVLVIELCRRRELRSFKKALRQGWISSMW